MTVLTDIANVYSRLLAASGRWPDGSEAAEPLLRTNWDVWASVDGDDMFAGLARSPHLAIIHGIDLNASGLRPVLASDMSIAQLHAGLWRQLHVLPDDYEDRHDQDGTNTSTRGLFADATGRDPFAPRDGLREPARSEHIRRIIGHTPLDLAEFLNDLLRSDPGLGRLLLAKDFRAALKTRPDAFSLAWPVQTMRRWERNGARDYLPPVIALAALTELARLSHNAAAHIRMSFGAAGEELFLRPVLTDAARLHAGGPVLRTIELAAFGSAALLPPARLLLARMEHQERVNACTKWTVDVAAAATLFLAADLDIVPDRILCPATQADAEGRRASLASHPRFWLVPRGSKGWSLPKGHAAVWWGLNWRMHGVCGLLDIAAQARDWSRRYRTGRDILPKLEREVDRSAAAILYGWVEAVQPSVLPTALRQVVDGINNAALRQARLSGTRVPRPLAHDQRVENLVGGESFGSTLGDEAREKLARAPTPSEQGYSARYRFHLWFDDQGDDLHYYARHQKRAVKRMKRALGDPEEACALDGGAAARDPVRFQPRQHPEARKLCRWLNGATERSHVLAARDCAMMMLPPATDLIHVVNAAPQFWVATESE